MSITQWEGKLQYGSRRSHDGKRFVDVEAKELKGKRCICLFGRAAQEELCTKEIQMILDWLMLIMQYQWWMSKHAGANSFQQEPGRNPFSAIRIYLILCVQSIPSGQSLTKQIHQVLVSYVLCSIQSHSARARRETFLVLCSGFWFWFAVLLHCKTQAKCRKIGSTKFRTGIIQRAASPTARKRGQNSFDFQSKIFPSCMTRSPFSRIADRNITLIPYLKICCIETSMRLLHRIAEISPFRYFSNSRCVAHCCNGILERHK